MSADRCPVCGTNSLVTILREGEDGERQLRPREAAQVGGDVVATVDGEPIRLRDLEAAAREARIPPALALRRLEEDIAVLKEGRAASTARAQATEAAAVHAPAADDRACVPVQPVMLPGVPPVVSLLAA